MGMELVIANAGSILNSVPQCSANLLNSSKGDKSTTFEPFFQAKNKPINAMTDD